MRVDMIDSVQWDKMMLAVGRCAPGELDLFGSLQMVDSPDFDAIRSNDVHVLGDLAAHVPSMRPEPRLQRPEEHRSPGEPRRRFSGLEVRTR